MIDLNTLLATLVSSTTIMVVLGFIAKSIFEQILSRDITRYKDQLDKEREHFIAELQKNAFENQIRFQNLHNKQADVIAELYSRLVQATEDADSFTSVVQFANESPLIEKAKKAIRSSNELHSFFEKNQIYFKPDLCKKIAQFSLELRKNINAFAMNIESGVGNPTWQNVWDKMSKDIPLLKEEIEQYFREILGM